MSVRSWAGIRLLSKIGASARKPVVFASHEHEATANADRYRSEAERVRKLAETVYHPETHQEARQGYGGERPKAAARGGLSRA